jgi:hypothetical protein
MILCADFPVDLANVDAYCSCVCTAENIPARDRSPHNSDSDAFRLVWMSVEAVVSLGAAWMARCSALLGFGGDSAVELLSAAVVLWRFHSPFLRDYAEHRAARIGGGLLFVLGTFVALASVLTLLGHVDRRNSGAHPCRGGHALATFSRYRQRSTEGRCRQVGRLWLSCCDCFDGSHHQCDLEVSWADPIAALVLLPLILHEGWQAMKGKPCCHAT